MEAKLEKNNNDTNILLVQAYEYFKQGNYLLTQDLCEKILSENKNNAQAYSLIASCQLKKEMFSLAIESQKKAAELEPRNTEHLKNLELMYRKNKQFDKALETIRMVLEIHPSNPTYKYCEGLSLCHLWRIEEAIAVFEKVLFIDYFNVKAHVMLGNCYQEIGKYKEATASFESAFAIDQSNSYIIYNRSLLLLLLGDFEQGLKDYEARWQQGPPLVLPNFVKNKPMWDGKDFSGKKLLILMEQGHGDMIQFCRYIPMAEKLGSDISVLCSDNLVNLLRPIAPKAKWLTHQDKIPEFDIYITMMSMPLVFGTRIENIPAEVPYIFADDEHKLKWKKKIKDSDRKKIGLCWSGSKSHPKDHIRSVNPGRIEKFIRDNPIVDFYILEKGDGEKFAKKFANNLDNVFELGSEIRNFSDSAAIIDKMDLVITVDTAVAHLAGAMAKPVWNLLLFNADWRWLLNRDDSPWYPTMRLFRQKTRDDWKDVLNRVSDELREYAKR